MRAIGSALWALTMSGIALAAGGTDESDVQTAPLERPSGAAAHPRTLEEIKQSGYLRILTRNNATSFFIYRGHRMGFDYELGKRLAQSLGIRAQFVVPSSWSDLIPALLRGEGDVVAGEMTVTPDRAKQVLFAHPYLTTVERVIYRKGSAPVNAPEDLAGKTVTVRRGSSYWQTLDALNQKLAAAGKPAVTIAIAPEELETEEIIERIARSKGGYTLADELIGKIAAGAHPELVLGAAISEPRELAWAVRPDMPDLAAAIDAMFKAEKKAPEFNILKKKYFEAERDFVLHEAAMPKDGALSPYDGLIKKAAKKYGFDWRLVAAQIYQESQFDPKRQSWCGAQGLFQLMPTTAKEVGVADPFDAAQSIEGGAKYMSRLLKQFQDVPDSVERYKFALAAYNCGAGHVNDARALAKTRNSPTDHWLDVKPHMLDLQKEKVHGQTQFGFCRCGEPVAYVQKIVERYDAYRQLVGDTP